MSLKNKLQSSQTENINASTTNSVGEIYSAAANLGTPSGAEMADNIMAKKAMRDCMMELVTAMESTLVYRDKNNIIRSKPIDHFYFCTRGGLTIGYGNKIECDSKGYPVKEGLTVLEKINLIRNNRELSLKEKIQVVKNCYDRRRACIKNKKNPVDLTKLSPEKQKWLLFNKNDLCAIDSQNAVEISRFEYENKNSKLIAGNPFMKDSYFLEALGTDFHYQFGDRGILSTKIYTQALDGKIPKQLYTGKQKAVSDRENLRELICKMAYMTNLEKEKRKGRPATPESQSAFCIKALQEYCKTFEKGIMDRHDNKILLMEKYMTLVFAQSIRNIHNRDLTLSEVKRSQQLAYNLVYNELFNSQSIQQLPEKIKPVTIVESIKNLNMNLKLPSQMTQTDKNPIQLIRESVDKTSESRIKAYNGKFKTNLPYSKPDDSTREVPMILANAQNGRW